MPSTDPVADMLTNIRNASSVGHPHVEVRHSRLTGLILEVLKEEGFIHSFQTIGEEANRKRIRIKLKYVRKKPAITALVRVSKPGARRYAGSKNLPRVLRGLGTAVMSTSNGVMTEQAAFKKRIGGEILCHVW